MGWQSKRQEKCAAYAPYKVRFCAGYAGYWEHHIRDERDFNNHVAYCYFNPVKHGLVQNARDWPHSTYHRDVRAGRFEEDFQVANGAQKQNFGEEP